MEFNTHGIKLSMASDKSGTYQKLYGLHKVPDMGGDREKIDVTNFDDATKRYIGGVADTGDLVFDFYYNKEDKEDEANAEKLLNSYKALKAAQTAGVKKWFKLEYPDGSAHTWQADVSVKRVGAGVNEALKFQLTTIPCSAIEEA